jgi:hypothetical protein
MSRRITALSVLLATLVATAATTLAPHGAAAAPSRTLGGARDEVVSLAGVVRPAATPVAKAAGHVAPDVAQAPRPLRRQHSAPVQPQATPAGGGLPRIDAPAVSSAASQGVDQLATVQGLTHDTQNFAVSPPDTTMSASSTTLVEAVNVSLLIMNRDGSNQQLVHLKDLWGAADARVANGQFELSDPRIIFDSVSRRWFTSIVYYDPNLFNGNSAAANSNSWIGLAASTDATPTTWKVYSVKSANGVLMDQPNLGINGDKVVAGASDFDFTQGGNWTGAELAVASKADMVAGVTAANLHLSRRGDTTAFGYAPAVAPTSAGTAYVAFNHQTFNAQGMPTSPQYVSVVSITGVPGGVPSTAYAQADIVMCGACGNNPVTFSPPSGWGIPQPNSAMTVDPGDDRFLSAVWQNNKLWTGGSDYLPQTPQSGLTLFEVDTTTMTLADSGTISSGAGESFAYPGLALDQNGTPYIAFSRGSSSRSMSSGAFAYVTSSRTVISAGILSGGAGQGPYDCHCPNQPPTRWGDYSGAVVDPVDPSTVWVATEYSAVGNGHENNWGTLLTRVTMVVPTLASASPNSGLTRGGTWVNLTGTKFDENSVVLFGGVPAQATQRLDEQHLRALTPPHRAGQVDVTVSSPAGSATIPGGFTFNLPPRSGGYWLVASDGGIFPFGNAGGYGSTGSVRLNQPIVGMAATPNAGGYWLVASDGGIFPFGNAGGYGSTGNIRLNQPIVGMAATSDGGGYWLVASDGGIFPFGNAGGYGSTGNIHLNQPVVGMAPTPTGRGYWLVASDGGIFPFGDAVGWGSTGNIHLNQPIVGMAATSDGGGYWLVASDGGIFPFGDAVGRGSTGNIHLNQPIVGMTQSGDDGGYWLVASDGGIFPFGDAVGYGSTGNIRLNRPMVGMAGS